ncbi:hypothetical protein [Calothrix sp. PCC 6303]|uniref:hypothetical protein n=1 Tax=Calothrix sp. PCC 6303 TaxID=1170562 RepID=UPI0002A02BC6|nr:hypothetical protein [Calothrix sp. PCC 6303]AFZ03665.1 hypothetical protein Cal6303_4766 [Calothrix sp. PCC 6303]
MELIEILAAENLHPQTENVTTTEQTQSSTFPDLRSLSVPDYLIGLSVLLLLLALICELFQVAKYKSKSQRLSNVELLEKIWKMEAAKVKE